jgi:hypothetical protein
VPVVVATAPVVVAAAVMVIIETPVTAVTATLAGEEAAPGLPIVPVQKEPIGQQATLPSLSREQILSVLQQEPASAAAMVEQEL